MGGSLKRTRSRVVGSDTADSIRGFGWFAGYYIGERGSFPQDRSLYG